MNRVKDKLASGGTVLVLNPDFPSPELVEHVAGLGFDVAFIDCEHGAAGFERVQELARAARAGGITSILRPWSTEPGLVTRFLDCGIGGIQFPHVDDAETAKQLIDVVRNVRGARFADTLITAMIESPVAVQNIDEIVAVEGLDAVVIGMADLMRALGHHGDRKHPAVLRALDTIFAAAGGAGCAVAGFNLHHWEDGPALQAKGVRWFTLHARTMVTRGAEQIHTLLGNVDAGSVAGKAGH